MPTGLHRTYGAHHLHFITCSCYRRLPLLRSARARDRFLAILEQTRQRYRFVVVGYIVMPEHVHLLLTEPEVGSPSTVMQSSSSIRRGRCFPGESVGIDGSASCLERRRDERSGRRASMISMYGL